LSGGGGREPDGNGGKLTDKNLRFRHDVVRDGGHDRLYLLELAKNDICIFLAKITMRLGIISINLLPLVEVQPTFVTSSAEFKLESKPLAALKRP
jgi:hypothetical protein